MKLFNTIFGQSPIQRKSPAHARRTSLQMEALEARDVPTAKPLPVLMVLADRQDFFVQPAQQSVMPQAASTLTQGQPVQKSAIVFVGGWGASSYQSAFNDPHSTLGVTDDIFIEGRIITG